MKAFYSIFFSHFPINPTYAKGQVCNNRAVNCLLIIAKGYISIKLPDFEDILKRQFVGFIPGIV